MKITDDMIVKPFIYEKEQRPWGYYGLYSDNIKSTSKILYIKPGERLSLQYHLKRAQFYLLLSDNFIIQYSSKKVPIEIANMDDNDPAKFKNIEAFLEDNLIIDYGKKFDKYGFHEYVIHRAEYTGKDEFGMILDIAFGINDENDICRIDDKYNRSNLSKF